MGWSDYCADYPSLYLAATVAKLDAEVPGDAHLDLMRAGLLPDPYVGQNLDHTLWMESKDWWYRCEFPSPPQIEGKTTLLVFDGLDTFATVWLNGILLGRTDNMFIRHEFNVTGKLATGRSNELVIRLASPIFETKIDKEHSPREHILAEHGPLLWSPERLFVRKAQMSFGWDIAPRLLTVGIWRPVTLVIADRGRLTDFWVMPVEFRGSDVLVRAEVEVEWFGRQMEKAQIRGKVHDTPWEISASPLPGRNTVTTQMLLKNPPLWFPLGYGKPAQIDISAELSIGGAVIDECTTKTGLRRIELVMEPMPSGKQSFRFRCNGAEMLVTGFNWTPLDAIFARITPQRITQTLEKLHGIGCTMLRVWGGGIYEPAHFYAECSRLGIVIWQDFMMACGWYPQTDVFAARLDAEARQIVRELRGFPCIGTWAGDNEVDAFYPRLGRQNRLTRATLAAVVGALDPNTPYVPSSPYSPSGKHQSKDATEGDTHGYDHGADYRTSWLWNAHPRFMSEFGHLSLPSMETIRKYFPAGTDWPLDNAMWKYHGADTIHQGSFRGPEKVLLALKACRKGEPKTIDEAVRMSQALQTEAVSAWIERYCEDPEFGGFMLWNVADCWPQHSDSVIDYLGVPKDIFAKLGPLFERMQAKFRMRARG
jgi:beta-mannosidase